MTPQPSTNGRLTIDPAAVVRNWQTLAQMTPARCGAVVKADAYGCGLMPIAGALAMAGCTTFFVATTAEGLSLRPILPGAKIYILNGVFEDIALAREAALIPFISSLDALAEWGEAGPFALNVDTGMNRLGLTPQEALALTASPHLIASHFACADSPDHPQNAIQEAAFAPVRAAFKETPASFANSAALLTRPQSHHDLVRPGIALYGGPSVHSLAPLEPAVRLEGRVIQVRKAKAGEPVGYGASEILYRDSRIAIVALGYADGFLRAAGRTDASAGAPAFVNGVQTAILGRVSMDLIAVDVTDAPCARGDWIEFFGPNVPIDKVAHHAGTIGYELVTSLSRRASRHYAPL